MSQQPFFVGGGDLFGPGPGATFPEVTSASADWSADAATIGFNFALPPAGAGQITPGMSSQMLVIRTANPRVGPGIISVNDGGFADFSLPGFAPTPEPGTLLLFGGSFLGLAGARALRRWKNAKKA